MKKKKNFTTKTILNRDFAWPGEIIRDNKLLIAAKSVALFDVLISGNYYMTFDLG